MRQPANRWPFSACRSGWSRKSSSKRSFSMPSHLLALARTQPLRQRHRLPHPGSRPLFPRRHAPHPRRLIRPTPSPACDGNAEKYHVVHTSERLAFCPPNAPCDQSPENRHLRDHAMPAWEKIPLPPNPKNVPCRRMATIRARLFGHKLQRQSGQIPGIATTPFRPFLRCQISS